MLFYLLLSLIYINGGDINHINPISNSISNLKNQLLEHNFLKCLSNDDFKNMQEAASIFAKNHFTHSSNFINHLQTVTNKINDKTFNSQLVSETQQELGNYKHKYIDKLTQIGVDPEWYNKIPHKYLSQRFFEATQFKIQTQKQIENTQIKHVENINIAGNEFIYNKYMTNLYNSDKYNECELFAVIGHSEICENIYNVLKYDTQLTDDKIVIFPLHILMEKQNDLIKQSFEKCMVKNTLKCKNIEESIENVLNEKIKMYDNIRNEIEIKQNYKCKQPFYIHKNKSISHSLQLNNENVDIIKIINFNAKYIAILMHIIGFLYILLRD